MDLKKEAARIAYQLIAPGSSVGLGDGSTIRWLADHIIEGIRQGLTVNLYTSSVQTQKHLQAAGISVLDITETDKLDQYFDGCDQVDFQLNAFKSGAGIHTTEKLLACMAGKFIILADDAKFVPKLENKYPLVLEVLPPATRFVIKEMKSFFSDCSLSVRLLENNKPVITRYGNYLIDARFSTLPELKFMQETCKNITGVVEISLFHQLANEAIIASNEGSKRFERKNNLVVLVNQSAV